MFLLSVESSLHAAVLGVDYFWDLGAGLSVLILKIIVISKV